MMFMLLGLLHLLTCAWWAVGMISLRVNHRSWNLELNSTPLEEEYIRSFHCSLCTLVGTTLIMPETLIERIFVTTTLFLSFISAAFFVSSITTSMTRLEMLSTDESRKVSLLKRYLADHDISQSLVIRVKRNAHHAMQRHSKSQPEAQVELLRMITEPLRLELNFEIRSKVLMDHPLFFCYNKVNAMGLRKICHVAAERINLSSSDVLFLESEVPAMPCMYFVLHGHMHYNQQGKQECRKIGSASFCSWMCEAALYTPWKHRGTLRAVAESQLLYIDTRKFQEAWQSLPTEHLPRYGQAFVDWLNKLDHDTFTDLGRRSVLKGLIHEAFPELVDDDEEEGDTRRSASLNSGHTRALARMFGSLSPTSNSELWRIDRTSRAGMKTSCRTRMSTFGIPASRFQRFWSRLVQFRWHGTTATARHLRPNAVVPQSTPEQAS